MNYNGINSSADTCNTEVISCQDCFFCKVLQQSMPQTVIFPRLETSSWQQCMQCYNWVLPRSIRCIWWRTQSAVEDWGQPTSVCHQPDDTEDKMTNDSAFFFARDSPRGLDRKVSMYAFINTISNISIGNLSNS